MFVFRKIKLVHHTAEQVIVNLATGSDEAGADFDHDSHNQTVLIILNGWTGDSLFLRVPRALVRRTRRAAAVGPVRRDNISILPLEWFSGKLQNLIAVSLYAHIECHQPLL